MTRRGIVFCTLFALSLPAGAESLSDTRGKVVRELGDLRNLAVRFVEKTGPERVIEAKRKNDRVDDLIKQYERAADAAKDSRAKDEARSWLELHRKLAEALDKIGQMHEVYQRNDGAPEICKKATAKMQAKAASAVAGNLTAEELIREAEALKGDVKTGNDNLESQRTKLKSLESDVKRLPESDPTFGPIFREIEDAAGAIADSYTKLVRVAEIECRSIAGGKNNPDVRDVLAKLKQSSSVLAETKFRWKSWGLRVQNLGKYHEHSMVEIRELMCNAKEDPATDGILDGALLTLVKNHSERVKVEGDSLDQEAREIHAQFMALREDKLVKEVEKRRVAVQNAVDGVMKGYNDPRYRTLTQIGIKEHQKIQKDTSKCDAYEVTIPGDGRIDCVKVKSNVCYVIEIKPDTQKKKAMEEADEYVRNLEMLWGTNDKPVVRETLRAYFRKSKLKIFLQCEDPKTTRLMLKPDWEGYAVCPVRESSTTVLEE